MQISRVVPTRLRFFAATTAAMIALTAIGGTPSAEAGTFTWNSNISGLWGSGSSWIGGTAPLPAGGDNLIFGSTPGLTNRSATNNIANNYSVASLAFSGTTGYTLSGSSIALGGDITNNSSRSHTINNSITTSSAMNISSGTNLLTFNSTGGGTFTNNGGVTLTSGAADFRTQIGGTGAVTTLANTLLTLPTGTVAGPLSVSGMLYPGVNNIRTVTAGTNMTLASTAFTRMDVGSDITTIDAGINYDQFVVGGTMAFGGVLQLNLASLSFPNESLDTFVTKWNLFAQSGSNFTGNFSSIVVVGGTSGTNADDSTFDYSNMNGTWTLVDGKWRSPDILNPAVPGQYLAFDEAAGELVVVPEPTGVVIAALGVAMAGWQIARQRRSKAALRSANRA